MDKDNDPDKWLREHKNEIPSAQLPPDRVFGKRVRTVPINENRLAAPEKEGLSEEEERTYAEEENPDRGAKELDKSAEADHQNRNYWELWLTSRERQIYDLLRAGITQPEIAKRLGITRQAVDKCKISIKARLGRFYRE